MWILTPALQHDEVAVGRGEEDHHNVHTELGVWRWCGGVWGLMSMTTCTSMWVYGVTSTSLDSPKCINFRVLFSPIRILQQARS